MDLQARDTLGEKRCRRAIACQRYDLENIQQKISEGPFTEYALWGLYILAGFYALHLGPCKIESSFGITFLPFCNNAFIQEPTLYGRLGRITFILPS